MSNDESNQLLISIAQRLSNIEGKLENLDNVDDSIHDVRKNTHKANIRADAAYNYAKQNDDNIERLAATIKWSIGVILTILVPLTVFILTVIFS